MNPQETLKALLSVVDTKNNTAEFVAAFKVAVETLAKMRSAVGAELNQLKITFDRAVKDLEVANTKVVESAQAQLMAKIDTALKEQEAGMNFIRDKVRSIKEGTDGKDGAEGAPGKDVDEQAVIEAVLKRIPPDKEETGDELIDKINSANKLISAEAIIGLEEALKRIGESAQKSGQIPGWGAHPLNIYQSSTLKKETARHLNFTGATISQNGDMTTIAISGGTGFTPLDPTETPDGNNKVFTFAAASAKPSFIIADNVWMKATTKAGTTNWTWNAGAKQATMTVAPQDDIEGIV